MLWKCCTQYASKFGKLSSGRKTGKGQFSFQSQRKAMPKNAQTTAQFHASHTLAKVKSLSRVWLFATPWIAAYQAPLSIGFSRREYWSGLPFPSPGDLPNPGTKPSSPAFQADSLPSEAPGRFIKSINALIHKLTFWINSKQIVELYDGLEIWNCQAHC